MKLVADARRWWRWFSVQSMLAAVAIQGAWAAVPHSDRGFLPEWAGPVITMIILTLGIIGRIVDQSDARKDG